MTTPEHPTPRGRSLVCSTGGHFKCDGNAPNGPAGVGNPCACACHAERAARQDPDQGPEQARDTSGLREAAQALVDEWDQTIADGGLVTIALGEPVAVLRAALAATERPHE